MLVIYEPCTAQTRVKLHARSHIILRKAKPAQVQSSKHATSAEKSTLPLRHVAIIMDGNRRWADQRALPRFLGHKEGVQSLKRLVKHVTERQLEYLTVYAFSSENWQRGKEEVDYLMQLFNEVLKHEIDELAKSGARLKFIGDLAEMPIDLQDGLRRASEKTESNSGLNLQVALNYGSRLELTQAVQALAMQVAAGTLSPNEITTEMISDNLYTAGLPDPDLMIRTGGDMRLSNYLLWQSAYTELYVTTQLWPDFTPADFDLAVEDFSARQRRYGGN
jgi:undecaprenyl diphosphate synthase